MEPVGFCGIIKVATQILYRNFKHFLCIAIIVAIQDAFLLALVTSSSSISLLYNVYATPSKTAPSPDPYTPTFNPTQLGLLITCFFVSFCLSLLVYPPFTFSVCRAVLNKSLDFKSSLLAVPRSALNLVLTELCVAGVLFGYSMAMMIPMIIVGVGLYAMGINPVIMAVIGSVVTMGGGVYLAMAWSLAKTVVILEGIRGWQAMKRSMYLVDGSKWLVLRLTVVFGECMSLFLSSASFFPITASNVEDSVMWRWMSCACVVLSVGLMVMIQLLGMASMVVLYLSCKSRFNEPLDTLIALSSQFGPEQPSADYMDLESARFVLADNKI